MTTTRSDKEKMLQRRAFQLATEQRTMVLATTSADAIPWAAPVYFVFYRKDFFFFSNPNARHTLHCLTRPVASAAIFQDGDSFKNICGLQMQGRIQKIEYSPVALGVFLAYLEKFKFINFFSDSGRPIDLHTFFERFNASMYRFSPEEIYCQDNSISFGYRQRIDTITHID